MWNVPNVCIQFNTHKTNKFAKKNFFSEYSHTYRMNLRAWSSQFVTKIFAHIKKEAERGKLEWEGGKLGGGGTKKPEKSFLFDVVWRRKLQNCKTPLSGHLHGHPTRVERRVWSQLSRPGQKTLPWGWRVYVCVCMFCVCCVTTDQALIELSLPPNWSYKRSSNKAIRTNQLQHASQTSEQALVLSIWSM